MRLVKERMRLDGDEYFFRVAFLHCIFYNIQKEKRKKCSCFEL